MRMEKSQSFNKRYFYNTSSCHGWVFPANHSYHLQLRKTPPWRGPVLGSCMVSLVDLASYDGFTDGSRLHSFVQGGGVQVAPGGFSVGWYDLFFFSPVCTRDQKTCLVGGFNPSEKYESNWKSSPNRGEHEKKNELPPPRCGWFTSRCSRVSSADRECNTETNKLCVSGW